MTSNRIRRHHRAIGALALTNSVTTTAPIDLTEAAGGAVLVPAGSSITALTYYGAPEPGGTYVQIYTSAGAVSQTVAAGRGYALPEACYGFGAVKIVANTSGSVALSLKG